MTAVVRRGFHAQPGADRPSRHRGTFVSMDGALVPPRNPLLHFAHLFPFSI
jgi:hypothetical protein